MSIEIYQTKYDNIYVSKYGEVFIKKTTSERGGIMAKIPYDCVYIPKTKERIDVHRLVAETFLLNPKTHPIVMHKDDNPKNNNVNNLKWGSYKDNMDDMRAKNRHKATANPKLKQLNIYEQVFEYLLKEMTLKEIGVLLNRTESRICQMKSQMIKWGWFSK
jgi:hypothetical protein